MQEVSVQLPPSKSRGYKIYVGKQLVEKVGTLFELDRYTKIMVVSDDTVQPVLLEKLMAVLPDSTASVILPAGEKHKDIESVRKLWTALHDTGCDRKSLVINLGGGVIGDMGGFAAATYMRGIDFLNVPTTLLAQVDASVGGKTGINFAGIKNLVGTFTQPIGVVIDPQVLSTLPEREFISGFGEIIKHGLVSDEYHFKQCTAKRPLQFTNDELADIITASCKIKLAIVQDDLHEGNTRKLVNFGHTIGHAIEALSLETEKPMLHGEAVSIGMVAEATISVKLNLLPAADLEKIKEALQHAGLPITISGLKPDAIRRKMQSDKKNTAGKLNFTLIDRIGHALYDKEVPSPAITEAIRAISD